jgi:hypothetical protein
MWLFLSEADIEDNMVRSGGMNPMPSAGAGVRFDALRRCGMFRSYALRRR